MSTSPVNIVMLAGKGISTNILYHALEKEFSINAIILEEPESRKVFLQKRINKLGWWKVTGQICFQMIIVPVLHIFSGSRKKQILQINKLDTSPLPEEKIKHVRSVNDVDCIALLKELSPNIVIVNGTRIISTNVLNSTDAVFINMHAGITPKYRGVHGGYWALVNKDKVNCGVTIHKVDEGIDTGAVIEQISITPDPKDNFTTYPLLQIAAGIPAMKRAITALSNGNLFQQNAEGESRLWSHPTFRQYIVNRISGGVK